MPRWDANRYEHRFDNNAIVVGPDQLLYRATHEGWHEHQQCMLCTAIPLEEGGKYTKNEPLYMMPEHWFDRLATDEEVSRLTPA